MNQAKHQYKQGCAVRARHIFSTRKDVEYNLGTSSVRARTCSKYQAHLQYKQGCAVQASGSSSSNTRGVLLNNTFQ